MPLKPLSGVAALVSLLLFASVSPAIAGASGTRDHRPSVRINFQPEGSPIPCGYLPDYGYAFNDRNSLRYGWNFDHSDVMRDRGLALDQRVDTLAHFHRGGGWGIALPHGDHEVTISIGDPEYASTYSIEVEGVDFWDDIQLPAGQFLSKTQTVHVDDGIMAVHQGWAGEKATRINYIDINASGTPDGCSSPGPTPTPLPTPLPTSLPTANPTAAPTPTKSPTSGPTPSGTPSVSPTLTPEPAPSTAPDPMPLEPNPNGPIARVNFQLEGSETVCGYGPDYGYTFTDREYWDSGWNFDHTDQARDRGIHKNQLLDTLNHFHEGGTWEFALPDGLHQVRVGIGDPAYASDYTINVEGVPYWDDLRLDAGDMRRQARMVEVTDGKLTIDQGDAPDAATRITHVEINANGAPDWCESGGGEGNGSGDGVDGPTTTGGSGTVGGRPYGAKGLRAVFGKPCNTRSNNARSYFPSAGGRGKSGYVYYHSKLARKIGGNVLKRIYNQNKMGAVDYGIWGYACRMKTGGSSWSVHSWGAAIDTNTLRNPWQARNWDGRGSNGKRYGRYLPDLYLRQGFYWGIHFRDPMHFQYVSGY